MSDKTKIIEKIRKCLALSKSSNEHEAAAALRQAQKLMTLHNIDEEDVDDAAFCNLVVVVKDYDFGRRKPLIIECVISLMSHAFGVLATWESHMIGARRVHAVRYFGTRSAVTIAGFAHEVVYVACKRAWREYIDMNPSMKGERGARAGFFYGWRQAVSAKVEAIAPDENAQRAKSKFYGGQLEPAKTGTKTVSGVTYDAGAERGREFDLHRPIGQDRLRLEKP